MWLIIDLYADSSICIIIDYTTCFFCIILFLYRYIRFEFVSLILFIEALFFYDDMVIAEN